MLARELVLYDFMFGYAQVLTADVADESMARQPFAGANHPAWIIGHLSVAEDATLRILGEATDCPEQWYDLFEPGTVPQEERALYPSKEELFAGLQRGHRRLSEAAKQAPADVLEKPNTNDVLRPYLPTVGHVLAHVLTTHPAMHCGQLAAWRRGMGLPHVTTPPKLR